jgi:glycosyltransferase involved in cell wall biosynthesis
MDDLSTDNTVEIIKKEIKGDKRFKLIINSRKAFALKNIYDAIKISKPSDEDIIVTVDGDDWLSNKDVLSHLNEIYKKDDCWLTYGSYAEYPNNVRGKFAKQIPHRVIESNTYRNHEWCTSHLRTFKAHLWNKIKREDLIDSEGNFYRMTWDLAFMFPMLEMSGHRSKYIEKILYVYNVDNPINDHKVDNSYQRQLEIEIRKKTKYEKI